MGERDYFCCVCEDTKASEEKFFFNIVSVVFYFYLPGIVLKNEIRTQKTRIVAITSLPMEGTKVWYRRLSYYPDIPLVRCFRL